MNLKCPGTGAKDSSGTPLTLPPPFCVQLLTYNILLTYQGADVTNRRALNSGPHKIRPAPSLSLSDRLPLFRNPLKVIGQSQFEEQF